MDFNLNEKHTTYTSHCDLSVSENSAHNVLFMNFLAMTDWYTVKDQKNK